MNFPYHLHELTATQAVRLIQDRKLTSEQLTRACLERIAERDPIVQAWTSINKDMAVAKARQLDNAPIKGLLHGLPLGIKDLFDTANFTTSYGSSIYATHRPHSDAAAVTLCEEAGAIVLGKTVTTEFATYQPGPTRNPKNIKHTPGGSSSGSAAAVSDYMVPLAFGTQTAASIIRPAAFCGVVGYKPSFGSVTRAGLKSLSESLDTIGGFGRSVADVALLLSVLTGRKRLPDLQLKQPPRIGVCQTPYWDQADAASRNALQTAVEKITSANTIVRDVLLPDSFDRLPQVHGDIMAFEAAQALAYERFHHFEQLSDALKKILNYGYSINYEQHHANLYQTKQARLAMEEIYQTYDVIIAPSTVGEATLGLNHTGDPLFCRPWTLLGLPCIHLPFTHGKHGLPVGIQVIGRFRNDDLTLQVAQWIHERL